MCINEDFDKALERYEALFYRLPVGVQVFHLEERTDDRTLRLVSANRRSRDLTGVDTAGMAGKMLNEIFPGLVEAGIHHQLAEVVRTGRPIAFEKVNVFRHPLEKGTFTISAFPLPEECLGVCFKTVRQESQKSEDKWRELFERIPSGAVVYGAFDGGRDFIFKEFNRAAEKIDGIERQFVLGRRVTEVFPGVEAFGLLEILQRVWKTGRDEYHPVGLYQDGRIKDCWRENWIYKLPTGDLVAIYNDVTERKQWEIQLNEALLRLRETVRAGNVGLWDWDLTSDEVIYSEEWKRQIGYEANEIQAHLDEWRKRVHPDDLEDTLAVVKQSIADVSKQCMTEFRFRHKEGTYRWILAQWAVIGDEEGKPARVLGSHVDITKRKKAEEALLKVKEGVNSLIEGLIDSLVVTDVKGIIRFANGSACRFFSKDREDLLGSSIGYPLTLDAVFEIASASREGEPLYGEAKVTQGEWEGEPAFLVSIRDITERKKALREREKLDRQLQQVDRIESIGQLAGGVAHDFNNMLSVILGYGEEIYAKLKENDPLREDVKEIIDAGKRSASLTRQLLAFSRRQTLQPEVLDLNGCVQDLEKMLHRIIGEDIELINALSEEPVLALLDPGQLEQVIVNLVVNARDSMPMGGEIIIETKSLVVDEGYAETHPSMTPGEYIMLSISDNGSGMDEETQARIFEPFFSTKEKGKGTGLGLSTVYGIVKQLGGYIWVYSELGHGTTFKVYFPKSYEKVSFHDAPDMLAAESGHSESILVVEDELSIRKLCQRMLSDLGYKTIAAANSGEALLLVEEKGIIPDLIITDVIMPEMSGKVLVDRLKGKLPDLKVLFMSGYTDNAIVHHGVLDSGVPLLQKPFSKEDLARKVREIIGRG